MKKALAAILISALALGAWLGAPVTRASSRWKAVVIDGALFGDDELANGSWMAGFLQDMGLDVTYVRSCNKENAKHEGSGWSVVRPLLTEADIIVYYGHGLGTDNPAFDPDEYWGLYLDRDYTFPYIPNGYEPRRTGYIHRGVISEDVKMKPNCLVGLCGACYSAGTSATDLNGISQETAHRRIANYADTFLRYNGARAYTGGDTGGIIRNLFYGYGLKDAMDKEINDPYRSGNIWAEYPYPHVPGGITYFAGFDDVDGKNPWWHSAVVGDPDLKISDVLPGYTPRTPEATELTVINPDPREGFSEFILTENPNDQEAVVTHYLMAQNVDARYKITRRVPPRSRDTVWINEYLPGVSVSVHSRSTLPVICERSMYFDSSGRTGGSNAPGVSGPAETWYFAEGYTGPGFDTWFLVQNPAEAPANVVFDFARQDGAPAQRFAFSLAARGRLTLHANELPDLAGSEFSTRVSSNCGSVIAERAEYFNYAGIDGGHVQPGTTVPAKDFYFAEGYTAERFDTYVLLYNPGKDPARVKLELCDTSGREDSFNVAVEPNRRSTVKLDDLAGAHRWDAAEVSARVTSDRPLVAERAMYYDYRGMTGGSDVRGIPAALDTLYMAEGCTREPFDTYVLIMNPSDDAVKVRMEFMPDGGANVPDHLETLGPHSRRTVRLRDLPGLASASFATTITCPDGGGVVAERAMYFDWQAKNGGHATSAVPAPSRDWYFAEGYTGD